VGATDKKKLESDIVVAFIEKKLRLTKNVLIW